jgi:hypothetical protein
MGDAMTKRRAAFVLLTLLCTACTQTHLASPPPAVDEAGQIKAADALQYESVRALQSEPAVLALAKAVARRDKDRLILSREDGRTVEFADARPCLPEGGDTQCTSHRLAAWLPSRHAFLVDVRRYEGGHYLLVDARSGESLEIASPPHFSPDGTRFATFDGDEDGGDGIRIWAAHGQSFVSEWNLSSGAEFVRWDGNDRLLVKTAKRTSAIVRSASGWTLQISAS